MSGLEFDKLKVSYIASVILDIAYIIGDKIFFENIANDLRSLNVILEFFHISKNDDILTHNSKNILMSSDPDYSLKYIEDYSKSIIYEKKNNQITFRDKEIIYLMYLLGDRYFPSFIKEII